MSNHRPTSAVDICNIALNNLGERGNVASIDVPESDNEVILARHYDLTREALLEEYLWNFARTETVLAQTSSGGADYINGYLLPADCLRLISMGPRDFEIRDWNIEGRTILINPQNEVAFDPFSSPGLALLLRYIKNVTDVSQFSGLFCKILGIQLALDVSYAFNNKSTQIDMLSKRLASELPKAVSMNALQKLPKRRTVASTVLARQFNPELLVAPNKVYWVSL
jgi:hypothetical protein